MRAVFFGSPEFAVPSLHALREVAEVALVVTQPDRRAGRGLRLRPPPVKEAALAAGLPVVQPAGPLRREAGFLEALQEARPDVAVVAAYGKLLPRRVLEAPTHGCVNVHASLLPRWRGASPVHRAIVAGDRQTGVCLMRMDEGLDTGPVLACRSTDIGPDETAGELTERLARLGAELLGEALPRYVRGELRPQPQPAEGVTLAPRLTREDGRIDWNRPARAVHDLVRGMHPWPGAWCEVDGQLLKVHRTALAQETGELGAPGTIVALEDGAPLVACGQGAVRLLTLQWAGRRRLEAPAFVAGAGWSVGTSLLGEASDADNDARPTEGT